MTELTIKEMARLGRSNSQRAVSYMDIANLFTKQVHYIRGNDEARAFRELWSSRDDVAYMTGGKGYIGREAVEAYFVTARDAQRRRDLPVMVKAFPERNMDESDKYLGFGDYEFHSLINPYIQVAGDNGTAKAVWWSPGLVGSMDPEDKKLHASFAAIIYTVDFINEDGQWKIWHMRQQDEFSFDIEPGTLKDMGMMEMPKPKPGEKVHVGPPSFTKEEIAVMMVRGQKVPGRAGENLRILHGMCSSNPPHEPIPGMEEDHFGQGGIPGVRHTFEDIIGPYETFDPSIGAVRKYAEALKDFLKFEDVE